MKVTKEEYTVIISVVSAGLWAFLIAAGIPTCCATVFSAFAWMVLMWGDV